LPHFRHLWRVPACLLLATCFAGSQTPLSAEIYEPSLLDRLWTLPILSLFAPVVPEPISFELTAPAPPPCLVEPLNDVTDSEALEFEAAVGTAGVVNLEGLTVSTARALSRFEQLVVSAGGRMIVKSAYRPAAYQAHLQELWDKWMLELRFNNDEACAPLRVMVWDEFSRHELLESQRPVSFSDHTRGMSFDAAVFLPRGARLGKRRVGIDRIARMAGVRRPAIAADPVHFRII